MSKARNAFLLGAAALITCTALGSRLFFKALDYIPKTAEVAQEYSNLEGRSLATGLPPRTLEAFASGEFQEGFETFASDALPFRSAAMLLNAQMQYLGVGTAGALFGYDALPTYYGSDRLYIPSLDAVTYLPASGASERYDAELGEFGASLARAAARYPQKRFVVYVVQGYQEPAANPAYDLMSDPYLPQEAVDSLRAALSDAPNVSVVTTPYGSVEDYYGEYFRSDHHWNIVGALRAYNDIASELGLEQVDLASLEMHEVRKGYFFIGATSRWSRHIVAERVFDTDIDYSCLTYEGWGQTFDGNDHSSFEQSEGLAAAYSFYDPYYNNIPEGPISGPGQGKALLVSNSYGGAIQRQLATQYETLWKSVALWPGYEGADLDELIELSGAEDVVFVANPTDYRNLPVNLPGFLGE